MSYLKGKGLNCFAKKRCDIFKGEKINLLLSSKDACYHFLFETIEFFCSSYGIPWIRKRINHQIRQCYFIDWREKQRNIRRYETWYCCLLNECTFITRVIQIQVRVEEHLIIRSWFAVLLLCDENKSYINPMHAQNMSRPKPKKSLVTIQRGQ